MKVVYKNQTKKHKNSKVCIATEYPLGDKDINGAVVDVKGRYPDKNRAVNLKCKELAYILEGSGKVVVEGREIKLNKGDMILIYPKERYYWDGDFVLFIACTPAWNPKQHRRVKY